ncbi:nucleopolyhedrovirus P10 family protein [Streptomyces sp. NPDC054829]
MTADGWTRAVRRQLGLGRLLPLGGARDGAWIVEQAAVAVLERAARDMPGVRLGALRIAPVDPEHAAEPAVPPPPSALWPGALRVSAEFAATAAEPLPTVADALRATLAEAADRRLGLRVTEVDLRVTALLEEAPAHDEQPRQDPPPTRDPAPGDETRAAEAALAVPGVTALTATLAALGRPVHIEERPADTALPARHVRVEIAVFRAYRAVDVAREVRAAVSAALTDHPTVAVLVTDITG